ncbi:MAG: FHA domain-containing protein [Blastocatellia bacterium]
MASNVISSRQLRLRDYRYPGELFSLTLTFFILLSLYGLLTVFFPTYWSTTVKTLMITLTGLGVYVFSVKLQQRAAFGTLVKVSPRQFPELYALAMQAAERLASPYIPVYVKRSSEMNIYTLGFWRHPLIVLTSSLVDQMEPDNLQFFIGREIGHVKASHTWLRTLLKPLGSELPVIGRLLNSVIFGDWINRAELTADRAGLIACRSLTTSVSTMLKFGVGIRLFEKLDIKEFLEQINDVRNVRGHLTEIVAEQPYLTQRVKALVRYSLSDQFSEVFPERQGHTQILKSMPEAFISSHLKREEIGMQTAVAIAASPVKRAAAPPPPVETDTVFDEAITLSDFTEFLEEEDENAFDPRLALVGADGSHALRRRRTLVGRNPDNDIVLDSDRISRHHVEFVREGDDLMIVDLESRNGIWLNGHRVKEPAAVKSGDLIRIGRQEFTFLVKE